MDQSLQSLEQVMMLMEKYNICELNWNGIVLKRPGKLEIQKTYSPKDEREKPFVPVRSHMPTHQDVADNDPDFLRWQGVPNS